MIALALVIVQELDLPITRPDGGHSYRPTTGAVTIDQAERLARTVGGKLVSLETAEEEAWLRTTFGDEPTWIGLEFPRETWVSGAPVAYTHWADGEPSLGEFEPYTVMGWPGADGAWNDVTGSDDYFRALIELTPGAQPPPTAEPAPAPLYDRCALVLGIEGLTREDLEDDALANLHGLLAGSTWTYAAAADPSADAQAGWGMLLLGVGSAKSRLKTGELSTVTIHYRTLLGRLEGSEVARSTAWIVDDPELAKVTVSGEKTDVRVFERRAEQPERRAQALGDALALPAPLCAYVGWTGALGAGSERRRNLATVDAELGAVLARVRARPGHALEKWLIALTAPAPPAGELAEALKRKKKGELVWPAVPLLLSGPDFAPGELLESVTLTDLVPTLLRHFGIELQKSWSLDGRPLQTLAGARWGENLLFNGDAEAQNGGVFTRDATVVAGWCGDGGVDTGFYRNERLPFAAPGPKERGRCHFEGPQGKGGRMEQLVDLRAFAAEIDGARAELAFSGWLGGCGDGAGDVALELEFLDAARKRLGHQALDPVGPAERRKQFGAEDGAALPGLLEQKLVAKVPARARALRITLTFSGGKRQERAAADELSVTLRKKE